MAAVATLPVTVAAQINAEQVLAIGRNVLSMDDYMLSIQYFNQAIKAKPYLADPYFFRAIAKLSLDDYAGAEEDCTLALERNRFKSEAYKVRGFARQSMGLDSLAIDDYNRGLEHNPYDKYFLFYKAVAQTESERWAGADSTFSVLLRQYPGFEEGYAARGRFNVLRGDTVAAMSDLDRAISIDPALVNAYLMRADINASRRQWQEAMGDMDQAVKLRPQESNLYVNRAFVRYNADDFFGAMSDYNYALQLNPNNAAALFNRALLRYEVKDLERSASDLTSVLALDPSNFHALYNRGLVYLDLQRPKEAAADFAAISKRYPRFYPAYYALAEAYRDMGDMRTAMQYARRGDQLVEGYITDPTHNRLDRPTIARAEANTKGMRPGQDGESEEEVMSRFNQLVTVSEANETPLSYNEKIKGRVQDRDVQVEPEPMYTLSFLMPPTTLRSISNYFRELDELNAARYIRQQMYLNAGAASVGESEVAGRMFDMVGEYDGIINSGSGRPVDYLARGVLYSMLKNYEAALADLDKAISLNPQFTVAYMARAYTRYVHGASVLAAAAAGDSDDTEASRRLAQMAAQRGVADALADYDVALQQDPRLIFAWFNKGNIYYALGDFTSAIQSFSEALRIDPDFGQAYFNRGISYLRMGNKAQAFTDLSKAGELGVLPSYNLLKRMK
ncbi:MAG: tetratricopeptide repeat protein [Muribaculaceae bacterium]|nr:tetratricopeptide repeat protein [Muribaculaceae bacterium]